MRNTESNQPGRREKPVHLRSTVVAVRLPSWLAQWMREHEESQGHLVREAMVEYYGIKPPSAEGRGE